MIEWFASHSFLEQVFLLSGTVGGIILVFRMILMVAGLDHHTDAMHVDSDAGSAVLHRDQDIALLLMRRHTQGSAAGHRFDGIAQQVLKYALHRRTVQRQFDIGRHVYGHIDVVARCRRSYRC